MGEALRVGFGGRAKPGLHGSKVTSGAGSIAYRDLDEAFGLTTMAESLLDDWRTGQNTRHTMTALLRQSVFGRLAGYEDTNDAERLSVDPALRYVVFQMAEVAIPRGLFAAILEGIRRLALLRPHPPVPE